MNLKEAREIARKVGATIEEKKDERLSEHDNTYEVTNYIVRLGVIRIGSNGTRETPILHATSPRQAADLAVVETGRAAIELASVAKRVYVDSDLIFGAQRS